MCIVGESLSEEAEKSQDEQTNQGSLPSPVKKLPDSPEKKKRKTKAELKEELTKQKVMEKKAALRRQRTRNKRWAMVNFCKRCIGDTEKEMGLFVCIHSPDLFCLI